MADILGSNGPDTLNGFIYSDRIWGYDGNDILNGDNSSDILYGGSNNDLLNGDNGDDQLFGGNDNDWLIGGNGKDTLNGGSGNDIFDFNFLSEMGVNNASRDVITDFNPASDKIDLFGLDANITTPTDDAFNMIIGPGVAFNQAGQLKFENGLLYGNVNNDNEADFAIELTGIAYLSLDNLVA